MTIAELQRLAGTELGVSDWRSVSQEDVDAFARVTGDEQWIHTDPTRAAATPFGGTIVHGYFTLSLAPVLLTEVLRLDEFAMAVNYGLDKPRFPAPLPVGSHVRVRYARAWTASRSSPAGRRSSSCSPSSGKAPTGLRATPADNARVTIQCQIGPRSRASQRLRATGA